MNNHVFDSIRRNTFSGQQSCRAMWPTMILPTDAERIAESYGYDRPVAEAIALETNLAYGAVCIYSRTLASFFDAWPAVATLKNDPRVGKTLELGHREWERATRLPAMRNKNGWRAIAVKVGVGDELMQRAIENGEPDAIRKLVERITAFVNLTPLQPYLGIRLGDREASRTWNGKTYGPVEFGEKIKAWELFGILRRARGEGVHRQDIQDELGRDMGRPKSQLLEILYQLKVGIEPGKWRLIDKS